MHLRVLIAVSAKRFLRDLRLIQGGVYVHRQIDPAGSSSVEG
jgi:hypothetical protein